MTALTTASRTAASGRSASGVTTPRTRSRSASVSAAYRRRAGSGLCLSRPRACSIATAETADAGTRVTSADQSSPRRSASAAAIWDAVIGTQDVPIRCGAR